MVDLTLAQWGICIGIALRSWWSRSRSSLHPAARPDGGPPRTAPRSPSPERRRTSMAFNLRNRSFLKELDFTPTSCVPAEALGRPQGGQVRRLRAQHLAGKNIALIFEKTSTRTRTAFEVAAHDQGAQVTYLEPGGSQIGHKESMKDTGQGARPDVRRHRVPGVRAGDRRDPGRVRRRAGAGTA
jgi:hypothetical protein